jgi:hypothetical protein
MVLSGRPIAVHMRLLRYVKPYRGVVALGMLGGLEG